MGENVRVACRVRPLNSSELSRGNSSIVSFPGDGKTAITLGAKTFNFDNVIQPNATQFEVYDTIAKPIVDDILNGYNGTIFAYGQTSSGKTFTMEGVLNDDLLQGIIPRIIRDIFNHIYQMDVSLEFLIKVSYFEIYLDKIRDLLDVTKTNLSVHEDKDRVPYVKGATERFVSSPEEVFDVIDEGKANRHVAVTNMNEHSSRSHSIFMITLRQLNCETQKKLHGKLYLVDLAGSEKVAKTGAEGTVLDEAKNINKSLSALGNVINALVENSPHVPYRDSKLTRILQESLGGNARTTMIICCSPAEYNEGETKSTLLFGMRAKTIKNCVTVNEELTADEWRRRFEREREKVLKMRTIIGKLESELEKWRNGERVDKTDWLTKDMYSAIEVEDTEQSASNTGTVPSSTSVQNGALQSVLAGDIANLPKSTERPIRKPDLELKGEQLEEIYQQLDDKDDEINKMGQIISQIKEQMEEQDLLLRSLREEKEALAADNTKLQQESETSKEETKEMLQALEELATNFQLKENDSAQRTKEFEEAQETLQIIKAELMEKESEIQQHKDNLAQMRKKHGEMLASLVREVAELGEAFNEQTLKQNTVNQTGNATSAGETGTIGSSTHLDEEFTKLRLHITKMKSEARVIQNRVKDMEEERSNQTKSLRKSEEEARELRMRVQESELRIGHLNEKVEENEARKRTLQDQLDTLNGEISMLRANEQVLGGSKQNEILASQREIQTKLDEELKRQSTVHQQQVKELRDQVSEQEKRIETQKDQISHLEFQHKSLTEEREKLQAEHDETVKKLEKIELNEERRLQAHKDLDCLQQTINKELDVLHNQRRIWMQQLAERLRNKKLPNRNRGQKAVVTNDENQPVDSTGTGENVSEEADPATTILDDGEEAIFGGNMIQQAKIAYLENNFAKLNKVHKQLLQNRQEIRNELVRMEKRQKMSNERITLLETSLKDAKEGALRDRKRYNHEIERIREAMRNRAPSRRSQAPMIVKGIRGGHGAPIPSVMGGGGGQQSAVSSTQH